MLADGLRRAIAVARAALAEERARPKAPLRRRDELEFLPAAVEVMETPASPVGRALLWTLFGLFALALAWSWIGQMDVVAIAHGKIVSTGRSKTIQPLEAGIVRAIHVEDGKFVRAGEVLIELDPTSATADRERLSSELMAKQLEAARLRAALAEGNAPAALETPEGADKALADMNRALLVAELDQNRARLSSLDSEIARKTADRSAIETAIQKIERVLPFVRERADARVQLAERGFAPRLTALELQQQVIEQEHDLTALNYRRIEVVAAITSLEQQRNQATSEFRRTLLERLAEAERAIAALIQELRKARQRSEQQTLTAPIDGIVQQLAVYTVGGVVTPAQTLLVLAPKDDPLELEALLLNRDIGFVKAGQEVEVKLETFLFTKYGTIPGQVVSISSDAVQHEKLGPVYAVRISLSRTTIDVAGQLVPLTAGMTATADIKTGRRRLVDYVLSPLMKYREESMRER